MLKISLLIETDLLDFLFFSPHWNGLIYSSKIWTNFKVGAQNSYLQQWNCWLYFPPRNRISVEWIVLTGCLGNMNNPKLWTSDCGFGDLTSSGDRNPQDVKSVLVLGLLKSWGQAIRMFFLTLIYRLRVAVHPIQKNVIDNWSGGKAFWSYSSPICLWGFKE